LLDGWPLTTPACGVAVAIVATASTSAHQGDLLTGEWHDHAAVDAAFARLRTELGPQAVVRPVACDEHRPERSGAWVEAGVEQPRGGTGVATAAAGEEVHAARTLTLRLLESPEEIDVEWSGGRLCAIWWRGRRLTIERASGPERLSGDWWKDSYHREYWRCEAEVGELLLFAEEGRWCVHGWYD
jgi:protein ImuB